MQTRKRAFGAMWKGYEPTEHPTIHDICWAAGIYEGEGFCMRSGSGSLRKNPDKVWMGSEQVRIGQKDSWLPYRLAALFGGSVKYSVRDTNVKKDAETYLWQVSGARARGFLMTIYSFLSPRRKEQVLKVLKGPQIQKEIPYATIS